MMLTIATNENLPEAAEYQAQWEDFKSRQMDSRVMWSLAGLYGYVHNTGWLVRQGMIGEIISAKPQARRRILEEAAGVAGLHSRRHEAELRLKGAEENLTRLEDVMKQVDAQIGGEGVGGGAMAAAL